MVPLARYMTQVSAALPRLAPPNVLIPFPAERTVMAASSSAHGARAPRGARRSTRTIGGRLRLAATKYVTARASGPRNGCARVERPVTARNHQRPFFTYRPSTPEAGD
jgi:hypothetical protein